MEVIKTATPIANKEHTCMLCSGKINQGQRYVRQTCTDGYLYDFICHTECMEVAHKLDMFEKCDNGLRYDDFEEFISEYVSEQHTDDELDDIAPEWQNLTYYETVCKILDEIKQIDQQPRPNFCDCTHFWELTNSCRLGRRFCILKSNNDNPCYHFKKKSNVS